MLSAKTFQGHSTKCHKTLDISQNLDENTHVHSSVLMNRSTYLGMLRQGKNGEEILNILNAINPDEESSQEEEHDPFDNVNWVGHPTHY